MQHANRDMTLAADTGLTQQTNGDTAVDTSMVQHANGDMPIDTSMMQHANGDMQIDTSMMQHANGDMTTDRSISQHANGDMTVLCRNDTCLPSLLHSWDVETFLEEPEEIICKYFSKEGKCPYQEVGCMFKHEAADDTTEDTMEDENEKAEHEKEEPIRHSARSRNRKINEESFKRLRDLSISCQ